MCRHHAARLAPISAAILVSAQFACGQPTGAGRSDVLRARIVGRTILLTTDDAKPVHYFAIDRASAPLIDWAPCTNPVSCPSVSRGMPVRLDVSSLVAARHDGGREAIVYHWQLEADGRGSHRVDSLRSVVVPLGRRVPAF